MNRVCFDLHWVLFCCWLYLHGVFLGEYWQFYWHLLAGKLTEIWGGEKNKQSHEQNPDPSLLPNHHTVQVQTKVSGSQLRKSSDLGRNPGVNAVNLALLWQTQWTVIAHICPLWGFWHALTVQDLFILTSMLALITHRKGQKSQFPQQCLPSGVAALKVGKGLWEQHPTMTTITYPTQAADTHHLYHLQNH